MIGNRSCSAKSRTPAPKEDGPAGSSSPNGEGPDRDESLARRGMAELSGVVEEEGAAEIGLGGEGLRNLLEGGKAGRSEGVARLVTSPVHQVQGWRPATYLSVLVKSMPLSFSHKQ